MQARVVFLVAVLFGVAAAATKGPCTQYFGPDADTNSTLITVVDPDAHNGFPFGNDTFVHRSGPKSGCFSPSPPAGCHRYFIATYENCPATCPLLTGAVSKLAGNMDTAGVFDRGNGALKACFDCLKSVDIRCYKAPADLPTLCKCPGA